MSPRSKELGAGGLPVTDEGGAVFVEYVIVLTCVALGCATVIAGLGPPLVRFFQDQVALLILPVP